MGRSVANANESVASELEVGKTLTERCINRVGGGYKRLKEVMNIRETFDFQGIFYYYFLIFFLYAFPI